MSEETEDKGNGKVEDGGIIRDWSPVDKKHRTLASRVQQVFVGIKARFKVMTPPPRQPGGTLDSWEPPDTKPQ